MKRSLLALSIAAFAGHAYAAPFMPMDARGLAMGNTGVASAKRAHAPAYNPSLLSQAKENDDFALLLPSFGVSVGDPEEMVDEVEFIADDLVDRFDTNIDMVNDIINSIESDIANIVDGPHLPADLTALQTQLSNLSNATGNLSTATFDLNNSLSQISGNPLNARVGLMGALAIPSKKFAVAVSTSTSANISARVKYSDSVLMNKYANLAQDLSNQTQILNDSLATPSNTGAIQNAAGDLKDTIDRWDTDSKLTSTAQVVAVAVADVGISFSREFNFGEEKVAIGITPKIQKIYTFHYADEVEGFDEVDSDALEDQRLDHTAFNLDVGVSYRFGSNDKWMVGLVGKNLIGDDYEYKAVTPQNNPGAQPISGGTISLKPQFRAGVAYNGDYTTLALDVDLTENKPVAFEAPTQYVALGAEFDLFSFMQFRAGYRHNLAESDSDVVSAGFGFSPFGVHIDIAAMANPSDYMKEAGVALEMGFYF